MYLDQLKAILNKYPDTMECFIRDNKLVCAELTNFVISEIEIAIPLA